MEMERISRAVEQNPECIQQNTNTVNNLKFNSIQTAKNWKYDQISEERQSIDDNTEMTHMLKYTDLNNCKMAVRIYLHMVLLKQTNNKQNNFQIENKHL